MSKPSAPLLTHEDLQTLTKGETPEIRAEAVVKVCRRLAYRPLDGEQLDLAQKIVAVLAQDSSEMVRVALVESVGRSSILTNQTAMLLANDVEAVACPLLEASPNFTEDNLIELALAASVRRAKAPPVRSQA